MRHDPQTQMQTQMQALAEALERAGHVLGADAHRAASVEPLERLLERCDRTLAEAPPRHPMRSIHHFACTGGTLMCRALFALPNTQVLSEIDPLSDMQVSASGRVPFAPTDLILAMRHSARPVEDETVQATFLAALAAAKDALETRGHRLILRDHAHSHFCTQREDFGARPTLLEMLTGRFETRAVLSVRHPLDSFLSLRANGWVAFSPATLDAYARRYTAFLDRYADVPVVSYEDFTVDPEAVLRQMCGYLDLDVSPLATDLIGAARLSGDSGRSGDTIAPRPRREIPDEIAAERRDSAAYEALCARLGYAP